MAAQRPADRAPAIRASAGRLPLRDGSVDAAMAMVTIITGMDSKSAACRSCDKSLVTGPRLSVHHE